MDRLQQLLTREGIRTAADHPLVAHSTFRIGGNARLALFPQTKEELLCALDAVRGLPLYVVGKGSNLVFPDEGLDGAVLFTDGVRDACVRGTSLCVSAGASLSSAAALAREHSLTGMEFAYGIPGTVGGAVFMNAGAYEGEMSRITARVDSYDRTVGRVLTLEAEALDFSYRHSVFSERPDRIILSATLALQEGSRQDIAARMEELIVKRKQTQPLEFPSAGSVFKRPRGRFAGQLIEECGLKGLSVGGAQVSEKHAGFIVNRGGATAKDVRELVELIRKRVLLRFGVLLETEIKFL